MPATNDSATVSPYDWDLLTETYDAEVPRSPLPGCPYVICSTARSGSSLLCDALLATGELGAPIEYFNAEHRNALSLRWECSTLSEYVAALIAKRSGPGGAFGIKMHWEQLLALRAELTGMRPSEDSCAIDGGFLEALLPGLRYLVIRRIDLNAQAVSYWTALQTGRWGDIPGQNLGGNGREAVYSYEGIAACRAWIEASEAGWARFFINSRIRPHEMAYEELSSDYAGSVRRAAAFLGAEAVDVPPARMRVLRDGRSREFVERFERERELHRADRQPVIDALGRVGRA